MNKFSVKKLLKKMKRIVSVLLAFALVFTTLEMRTFFVSAEERTTNTCGNPAVKVYFSKWQGGNPTSQSMTSLLGKNDEFIVDVATTAEFTAGKADKLNLKIELPYFYYSADNELITTYDINKVPEAQRGENLMGIQARIVDNGDYDLPAISNGSKEYLYRGTMIVNGEQILMPKVEQILRIAVSFYGNVPENTAANIQVGGGYKNYYNDSDERCEVNYTVAPGVSPNSIYTLINSNLAWESLITQVERPVLWDKYNYFTYQVTMKNVSTDEDSYFSDFDFNFMVPNVDQKEFGTLDEDIMAWIYNENGDPIKNEDHTIADRSYVGVPNQGGVLVYDVTDKTKEELDKWDLSEYSNVADSPMVYHYTNNRTINIPVTDKKITMGEERTYYVAIPFPNNIPDIMGDTFTTQYIPTIYFNKGLSWSKTTSIYTYFGKPAPGFTHEKYVLDQNGQKTDHIEVAIGDTVNYYLSGFENTGNLPAFNPVVTDTLPKSFDLKKLSIEMDFSQEDPSYIPSLEEWFKKDNLVEFEFKKSDGTLEYVSLGQFNAENDSPSSKVWSINMDGKIKDYLDSNPGAEFTGQMRFNLAEKIKVNQTFNGRIVVNGEAPILDSYYNTLDTNYEMWIYVVRDGDYTVTEKSVQQDDATVDALPGDPMINVDSYHYDGTNYIYNDPLSAVANQTNTGFRYQLGNNSISQIIPAIFKSGSLIDSNGLGLVADSIKLSSDLVKNSVIENIRLTNTSGTWLDISGNSLTADSNGDIIIDKSQWASLGNLAHVEIKFKSFKNNIPLAASLNIMINGTLNMVGTLTTTGSFETQYNDVSVDKYVEDSATINITPGAPIIDVDAYHYDETNGYSFGDPLGAAVNNGNSGYRYRLGNTSVSQIAPAAFTSGNMISGGLGLIVDSVTLSKGLLDVSEINDVIIRGTSGNKVIPFTSLTTNDNGDIVIKKSQWNTIGNFQNIEVRFNSFKNNIAINDDVHILINGTPNVSGNLTVTGSFTTQYSNISNITAADTGTLNVQAINPVLTGKSFDTKGNYSGTNTPATLPTNISRLTVANNEDNNGYEFEIGNGSNSDVGSANVTIDLTGNVGDKNVCTQTFFDWLLDRRDSSCLPMIKGFDTSDIYLSSNYELVGEIDNIQIFDWDQDPKKDTPKLTLPLGDISKTSDGRLLIDKATLNAAGIERLLYIHIEFKDFYGQTNANNPEKLKVTITGNTDWYDNLDAVLTFNPENPTMTDQTKSVTAGLTIKRPGLMLHTDIYYYDNTLETSNPASGNSDGNLMRLGIPYDRDFKYRVSIENTEISHLDDVDLLIELPINANTGDEANTGFHTTKVIFNKKLFEQFTDFKTLTLFDRNDLDHGIEFTYDKTAETFTSPDYGTITFNSEGELVFDQLKTIGIDELGQVTLSGLDVVLKNEDTANAWIDFYGYSDSYFGTENTIKASAENYINSIRDDNHKIASSDTAVSTVSKMYFDTILTAGYKDSETGERFDQTSTQVEDVRHGYRDTYYGYNGTDSDWNSFKDDSELDIGYKAIGSYMLDFRQYLNVGYTYPADANPLSDYLGYVSQEHRDMNYIYTQSFNTAANLEMTMNLPSDKFDTYYIKVDPRAIDYLQSITITRSDGTTQTSQTLERDEWISKVGNGIEQDQNNQPYFRINLADENADLYETVAAGSTNTSYYKSPIDYEAVNPVTSIVFNLNINQTESGDGINANNPDFGSWYNPNNQKTKYMFEVTGRFYETGKAEATASTQLKVGSDRSKERIDSADKNVRSNWSYSNTYQYKTDYYTYNRATAEYDARHLQSTAWVNVRNDVNKVLKGVHDNPNLNQDIDVEYGKKDYFSVSFYRESVAYNHDYKSGNNGWTHQDLDDFISKISYADEIILKDTLPKIRTDEQNGYYGFLTEDITIPEALYKYVDRIEILKQHVEKDPNSSLVPDSSDGMKGYKITLDNENLIVLTKDDLGSADENGHYQIKFQYKERDEHAVSSGSNDIVLEENDYIFSYKIILKNIPGNGDFARELLGNTDLKQADFHGTNADVDIKVGGYVYLIKNINPVNDAVNTVDSTLKNDYDQKTLIPQNNDTAYLMGFRIPFKAGFALESLSTGTQYDYESVDDATQGIIANITPHQTSYGVKLWNQADGSGAKNKATRIKQVNATVSLDSRYNMKSINFPKEFVEGNWFNIDSITLNSSSISKVLDYNAENADSLDLSLYLTKTSDPDEHYEFDVDQFIRDYIDKFPTYKVDNSAETYIQEHINSFVVTMSAVNPDTENDDTLLAASQYLTVDKAIGYTFTYDGVWVNRTETDVKANDWTGTSRPTFGMTPNAYPTGSATASMDAKFIAADFNAENYQGNLTGTTTSATCVIANLVGKMNVAMERGKTLNINGINVDTFAYDRHLDETTNTNMESPVANGKIIPHDYIDYTLTVGADVNSAIPLQHTDMRFTAPTGQRIIGWEIASNSTNIQAEDITATVKDNGSDLAFKPDSYYIKDSKDNDTNYKELNISIGNVTKSEIDNQIQKGQEVKIVVYTQTTDELKDSDGNPNYEEKVITAKYEAASKPKHTYSQYSITGNKDSSASWGPTYYSKVNDVIYYRNRTDFYRKNGTPYTGSVYTSIITSDIKFKEKINDLWFEYIYDDTTSQYDGQPMTLKVSGKNGVNKIDITNNTKHNAKEITFEVSFLSKITRSDGTVDYFKGFELNKKPEFKYPVTMTSAKPIKVEYLFEVNGKDEWIGENDVKEKDSDLNPIQTIADSYYTIDAKKIRWTYYDVPALGSDNKEVTFATTTDPFIFEGTGRYNDTRQNDSYQIADRFEMTMAGTIKPIHEHNVLMDNTIDDNVTAVNVVEEVKFEGAGQITKEIARERPVITYQTQIFNTEDEAKVIYNPDIQAVQKNSYRPNDKMWYKLSVINNKLNSSNAATGYQGAFLNPVFYDKIPEYVTADMKNIKIRWLDKEGNERLDVPSLEIKEYDINSVPDYGGDMVVPKGTPKESVGSNITGKAFDDIKPTEANSTKINYKVYEFSFAEDVRLEVGESIEIWYEATAREENLPMVYTNDNGNIYPEYYPKMGEYYQTGFANSYYGIAGWPLVSGVRSGTLLGAGAIRSVDNSGILMDMNYLIHDAGITGTVNANVDKWEFLRGATTFIPGTAANVTSVASIYGDNGTVMDYDSASGSVYQAVKYVPTVTGTDLDVLPTGIQYQGANNANRDQYEYVVKPRTDIAETAWDNKTKDQQTPIVWSEARTHLQAAWLATSSEIIPTRNTGESDIDYADHAKEYLGNRFSNIKGWDKSNPNYPFYQYRNYGEAERKQLFMDDCISTLEYKETYTARLSAYNYGDWQLDGVEFIYVLPTGMAPQVDENGKMIISANTLTGGDSLNPIYSAIDSGKVKVEVLQEPGVKNNGYLTPRKIQDPFLVNDYTNTTTDIYSDHPDYYTDSEAESWVIKITVDQELSKWFNRGTNKGYILNVDIECVVETVDENEYWYDKVFASPKESVNSQYSQIFDITAWQGATKDKVYDAAYGLLSTQYGGMDYLWDGYGSYGNYGLDATTAYNSGSPNTPYINGFNIQNNEVMINENINGKVVSGDLKDYYGSGKIDVYASTGTRAKKRKPLIRTWTTLGNDLDGKNIKDYYLNAELDESSMNIHVENNYYWNDLSTNWSGSASGNYGNSGTMRHLHNYSTDGGNRGTFFFPVVTNILPENIVPKDINGQLFTTDNSVNAAKQLSWTLYDGATNLPVNTEQNLYQSIVEYIEIDKEDGSGKEGRYKITFYQDQTTQGNNPDAKIVSGDTRIFSFDFTNVDVPDDTMQNGEKNSELLAQYQTNNTYVTSQLPGFKFITDKDITGNPYTVGALWNPYYDGLYLVGDNRKDAIYNSVPIPYSYNSVSGGVIPNNTVSKLGTQYSIIDAVEDGGVKRYDETDSFNLEDYPHIRTGLNLNDTQKDFNLSGELTHSAVTGETISEQGVTTSMRIRVKYARMETETYVSDDVNVLGMRDDDTKDGIDHYPTINFDDPGYVKSDIDHKQFGDYLWYTTQVMNKPENSEDYAHAGDILHSKISIAIKLPSNVSYEEDYYFEFEDSSGQKVKITKEDIDSGDSLRSKGWQINYLNHVIDPDTLEETLVFEVITAGEAENYQDYYEGKNFPGYFASDSTFDFKVKTVIDHLESPDTLTVGENYWDEQYAAKSYVTLKDTGGNYLNILGLIEIPLDLVGFERQETDYEKDASIPEDVDLDHNYDGDLKDVYATDLSARVTVLKPSSTTRLDTSVKHTLISNPDAGIVVAEDPSIKGATAMNVYLDQVVNLSTAVPEFIIDYRVPSRGTETGTLYEAPMTAKPILSMIKEIRTGVWEMPAPDQYTGSAPLDVLKNKLKVHIYVLTSANPPETAYINPGNNGDYTAVQWKDLGSYSLTENAVINLEDKDYNSNITQIRYVIKAEGDIKETVKYPVPKGFRLSVDADPNTDGIQEMDEVDPKRDNINELPQSIKDNAAYVRLSSAHMDGSGKRLHLNNFATGWSRYDDSQYSATSSAARAGYYVNAELPYMQVDLEPYYFHRYQKEDKTYGFEWSDTDMLIKQNFSTMLKYKASIHNLTDAEIEAAGFKDETQDNLSKPQISTVLPYLEDILDTDYKYVDVLSAEYQDSFVRDDYSATERLERKQSQWTYYVLDEAGNIVTNSKIKGVDFVSYSKSADLSGVDRKILTWSFDGFLEPGQTIVVDYMVPLATKDFGMTSTDLMKCSVYGYKQGSLKPFIPKIESSNETYAFEIDKRDINDNGMTTSEATLVKGVGGISFESRQAINRLKFSYSEYDTAGFETTRPSLVPEGTDYQFKSIILNPDIYGIPGYKETIIYDVLPYDEDKNIVNAQNKDDPNSLGADRNSKWNGWVIPESVKLLRMETPSAGGTITKELVDGTDCEIWVGPFEKTGGQINVKQISDLPAFKETSNTEFYSNMYADPVMRSQYFVRLSDLKAVKASDEEAYTMLTKNIQAIWAQVADGQNLGLDGGIKFELNYYLHAPLNLPQYNGAITSDMGDDVIRQNVADYTGWNTFAVQAKASSNDNPISVVESPRAGVYLNAPVEKGYIGSYVWYDANYNADIDEGEYVRRDDGRLIFKNKTKDLDYDGINDDPGINGVLVELLSENGYPVNKLGEAVVEEAGTGKFIKIDETTGMKMTDINGTYEYSLYGPATYTTEADAYGNNGYFVISNVTPGNYKLRYTFPEKTYNTHALTTLEIGDTKAKMDVYRDGDTLPDLGNPGQGDVESDAQTVTNKLVVQTADSIRIDAIGSDPSTYAAYDAKMTSYNVGVSKAYIYAGTAWVDETVDPTDSNNVISDGFIGAGEKRLENVDITFYEVTDTGLVLAKNADGKDAITKSDADGYFEMSLYPERSYLAVASTANTDGVYKPSPITINTDPKMQDDDNDLTLSSDKKTNQTFVFTTGVEFDAANKPILDANGNYYGIYNHLGLGFVEAGRGYIGKYVWNDVTYDGLRGNYIDANNQVVSEPGMKDIKLILERYYFDDNTNEWKPVPEAVTAYEQLTNSGGSYTFQNVKTTYTLGDKVYLAGYKLKVDTGTLPQNYTITKFNMNNGLNDSKLPISTTDGYLDITQDADSAGMIIIAEKANNDTPNEYINTHEGVNYDISNGKMILNLDLGLTSIDTSTITGTIWDDKNYDGLQDQYKDAADQLVNEPGISNVTVELEQYYYQNGQWIQKTDFVSPTVLTDMDGHYEFSDVASNIIIDSERYMTGYKVKVDQLPADYAVSKYRVGSDDTINSDLKENNLYLNADDEYITVAEKVTNVNYDMDYIIQNNLGNYDVNKVTHRTDYDGGLIKYEKADLKGTIWEDKNYNGLMDTYKDDSDNVLDEPRIENVDLQLQQYYLDGTVWKKVPEAQWNPLLHQESTDVDGNYAFKDLDTYVHINNKNYLAGYQANVLRIPDKEKYAVTLYKVPVTGDARNSDLTKDYQMQESTDYLVIADEVAAGSAENTPYIVSINGKRYDFVTAKDNLKNDGGFVQYEQSTIKGNVFEDEDYDGIYDTEENYAKIKEAVDNGSPLEVTLKGYYQDENGIWQVRLDEHNNAYEQKVLVDDNGQYVFSQVDTQIYASGKHYLAGYQLFINTIPDGFGSTRYLMNGGRQDSTLYKQGSTLAVTKTTQDKGYVGSGFEELNGYIIPAYHNTKTDNVNTATVINGYDIVKSRDLDHYNIGFTDKVGGQIKGTIFDDENYDGFYGENEAGINGIDVYLEQYYLLDDGTWTLNKEDYAQTQTQTVDGKEGIFLFDAVPTHITTADGKVHLASYKVKVGDIPEIYGITYLNMRSQDSTDIYDETRDSDLAAATHYLTSGDGKKTSEEYILTAYPLQETDPRNEDYIYTYNGQGYDILDNQTINDFDGGLVRFKQGSIEGDVWLDSSDNLETSYDGIKNDNELGIADQTVILSQYLLKNGKWELVEDGDLFTATNENGHYLFSDLPVYKEEDDGTRYLYGYQLKLETMSEEYAVTKYRQGDNPVKDSDLNVETSGMTEANEYIILAHDATHDGYINKPYTIKVDNGWLKSASYYDILVGEHNKDYSAGHVEYQLGSIEGIAFEDEDYDGIYNNSDQVKAEVLVKLKRYYYNSDERKWIEDNRSPRVIDEEADDHEKLESIYRQMLTDKNGHYIFDHLETYKEIDGKRYIYGYQLWINDIPQGSAATKYQQNNGENDSALKADTKQLVKNDVSLPEMNSGYLTVAENISQESYQNTHYVIGKYDTIAAKSLTDYNAGFTSIDTGSISGIVWEDEDQNGIRHETEKGMADIEVILETYYYQQGKWQQLKDKVILKAITSEEGKYEFSHLPTYGYVDDELVLYGYKVKIENYPGDYEVTSYHANDLYLDSDLNGNTGYLSEYEELMVLASKADQTIDPLYTINGYNIVKASNIRDLDAGFSLYDPEYETVIENVDTGDRNQLMGAAGLLVLSGIAFIALSRKKKEKNEKE